MCTGMYPCSCICANRYPCVCVCVYGRHRWTFSAVPQELLTSHILRQCYGYRYIPPCLATDMGFVTWNSDPLLVQEILLIVLSPPPKMSIIFAQVSVCSHRILLSQIKAEATYFCRLPLDCFTHTSNLVINSKLIWSQLLQLSQTEIIGQKQVMNCDNSFDLLHFEGFHFIWIWAHTEKYVAASEHFHLAWGWKRGGNFILPLEPM